MPSTYTWPLSNPPAPATSGGETAGDAAAALLASPTGGTRRGLLTPFARGASDFLSGEGVALINSEIRQVLGTRCSSATTQGEIPWRTEFGSLIDHARWKANDEVLGALLYQWAADAIARWLRNIRITETTLERRKDPDGNETIVVLRIFWELAPRGGRVVGFGDTSVPLPTLGRR